MPGPSQITIQDVARAAGVSPATVSRVLNGTAGVKPEKIEKVRAALAQFGYKANPFARSLLSEGLKVVGVLVPNLQDEFYGSIVTAIEKTLRAQGLQMMCALGHDDVQAEQEALSMLLERGLDGLILLADHLPDALLLDLKTRKVPFVLLNRSIPEVAEHCLRVDNFQGGHQATRHLLDLGHTRIAHLTGPLNRADTLGRYNGYLQALRDAGLEMDEALVLYAQDDNWSIEAGEAMTERLLARTSFTAIFTANDPLAVGALKVLHRKGFRVPEDISIVGFDNRSISSWVSPALTVMDYPKYRMGETAATHLIQMMSGQPTAPLPLLPLERIERESTATRTAKRGK